MIALLDANVLIALFDPDHIHNARAQQWMTAERAAGWATCALTQNACIRILSQSAYSGRIPIRDAARRLQQATQAPDHRFWHDSIQGCDPLVFDHDKILTSRHLTDLYLLALCVENDGRLVTFDKGIQLQPVLKAAARHLVVL
ncbi:TA system VapC family ribonuclease toxin [Luteolibacter sp. Populi]|uniref:TA system VapC family ribonuclease toxin n=1 Tax=Luteolibacter sp. Populi TaxID=3230487 RepID=UPI003465D1DC